MAATFASDLLQSAQLYRTVFDERLEAIGLTSESYVLLQAAADWNGRPWRFLLEWPATPSRKANSAILPKTSLVAFCTAGSSTRLMRLDTDP